VPKSGLKMLTNGRRAAMAQHTGRVQVF